MLVEKWCNVLGKGGGVGSRRLRWSSGRHFTGRLALRDGHSQRTGQDNPENRRNARDRSSHVCLNCEDFGIDVLEDGRTSQFLWPAFETPRPAGGGAQQFCHERGRALTVLLSNPRRSLASSLSQEDGFRQGMFG